MSAEEPNILLLDYVSETNLGDLALQEGLIRLVREHFPRASLGATVIFGENQDWRRSHHFAQLERHEDIATSGALRPTFYPLSGAKTDPLRMELKNVVGALAGVSTLLLIALAGERAERFLPGSFARTCRLIRGADIVVCRGRNFRATRWFIEPYRMGMRLLMPLACLLYGKPVFNISSSFWPLRNPLTSAMLRAVLRRCSYITVRESASLRELEALLGDDPRNPPIAQLPDLCFAEIRDRVRSYDASRRREEGSMRIALTLMDWAGDGPVARDRYVQAIAAFIEHAASTCASEFYIVPQAFTPWEASDEVVDRILSSLSPGTRERVIVTGSSDGVDGVLEQYEAADYLIGTRMHSAIFALSKGTPVVAIACDRGSKWHILDDLGYGDYVIPHNEITAELLIERFELLRAREERVMPAISRAVRKHCRDVDGHVAVLHNHIPHRLPAPLLEQRAN